MISIFTHPAFLVGLGGALGSNARYWLGRWFKAQPWASDFFWGTLFINISGSLLLGLVVVLCRDRAGAGFLLFGTGFCGGYTTFSTFSLEVTELFQKGRVDLALLYVLSSVLGGFLAFWLVWIIATPQR
jgi:CrcB protein